MFSLRLAITIPLNQVCYIRFHYDFHFFQHEDTAPTTCSMDRQLPSGSVPTIRRPGTPGRDRTGRSHEPNRMGLAPMVGCERDRTRRRIRVVLA
jgi:hypothetical protein